MTYRRFKLIWPPVLIIVLLLLLLQLLTGIGVIRDFIIPPPTAVFSAMVEQHHLLWPHIRVTTEIALIGFVLAVLFGSLMSILMERVRWLYRAFYPLIVASQTIPTIVITPVIVLLFGFGTWPRLVVVVLVCFFPLTLSFLQGLYTVDPDLIRLMRSMGANEAETLLHVKLPASLPSFFAGLKISATYCVTAAVLSEWSGSGLGLGVYMMRTKRSYAYDRMFASIVWIVLLSLIIYLLSTLLEYLFTPWLRNERKKHATRKRATAL
ncbi:MAG TPA: ABC transporter permease [Fastidiosipila sp.]|nr:ABC transporter permease [Fastidiosipila sp.]